MVETIDKLVTHYALDSLPKDVQKSLASLVQTEAKGMKFVTSYLQGLRKVEMEKATGQAKFSSFKGHTPSVQQEGISLVIANDSEAADLALRSFKRLGDYKGSSLDRGMKPKGYYYAPVEQRAGFQQGISQNAHQTANGVNVSTGFSEGLNAGRITHPGMVAQIAAHAERRRTFHCNTAVLTLPRLSCLAHEKVNDRLLYDFRPGGKISNYPRCSRGIWEDRVEAGRLHSCASGRLYRGGGRRMRRRRAGSRQAGIRKMCGLP